jgi:hypothetical protein
MTRPTLFVEGCAGVAALSLCLQSGRHARPLVPRIGNKSGYALAILRVLGLRPGEGAARYIWCEPDPGCRLLLEAYRDPALSAGAAALLRAWATEDPRTLFGRLRDEGPPVLEPLTAHEVARWAYLGRACYRRGMPESGYFGREDQTDPALQSAARIEALHPMPATIRADIRDAVPIPRADVLEVAHRWHAAGATVAISEAVPLPLPGWHHVRIDGERRGSRTFSVQQAEWLTLSHPPAWTPSIQRPLFAHEVTHSVTPDTLRA